MNNDFNFLIDSSVLSTNATIDKYYNISFGLAFVFFLALFVAEIFQEQINSVGNTEPPSYINIIKRAVIVMCGLVGFKFMFFVILGLCEHISMALFSQWQMVDFYDSLYKYKEANQIKFNLSSLMTGKWGIIDLIVALVLPITFIIEQIILIMRSCLLSVLYIVGPLALVAGLWRSTRTLTVSWFKSLFQISFWIIIFRAIEASFVGAGVDTFLQADGTPVNAVPIKILLICIVFIGLLCMSLAITMKICSGENLGTIGSAAVGVVSAFATRAGLVSSSKFLISKTGQGAYMVGQSVKKHFSKSNSKGNGGTINKTKPRR